MSEMFNPHAPATAYDHNTTIVAVLELSGKNWLLGAVAPGLSRRTKRSFDPTFAPSFPSFRFFNGLRRRAGLLAPQEVGWRGCYWSG
jgi:hypothetical protein